MLVSAITFISITFIGGMWSASLTNVLNIILIYFGIVVATFIQLDKVGGIDTLAKTLPANVLGSALPKGWAENDCQLGNYFGYSEFVAAEYSADFTGC